MQQWKGHEAWQIRGFSFPFLTMVEGAQELIAENFHTAPIFPKDVRVLTVGAAMTADN